MNYLYKMDGLRLVPYPAQFAVPLFPAHIKEKCLVELNERYQQVSLLKITEGRMRLGSINSKRAQFRGLGSWALWSNDSGRIFPPLHEESLDCGPGENVAELGWNKSREIAEGEARIALCNEWKRVGGKHLLLENSINLTRI